MRGYGFSHMYYQPSFWPEGFISLVINMLIWGLIIYLAVHLFRKLTSCGHGGCCGMSCGAHEQSEEKDDSYYLSIAKERYAKGEIDKKHYDELKKDFSPHRVSDVSEITKEE